MKRNKSQNMEEVIDSLFKQMGISTRMKEMRIINGWEKIVGKTIAKATTKIDIYNRVLFIKISSAAIRSELLMIKTRLISVINSKAGAKIIDDIIIK